MSKTHRLLSAGTLLVCLIIPPAELFASEPGEAAVPVASAAAVPTAGASVNQSVPSQAQYIPFQASWPAVPASLAGSPFAVSDAVLLGTLPSDFDAAAQRGYRGRRGRYRGGDRRASAAAMAIGAVASITGTALLVYANRPECAGNPTLQGCGYGTKVVGGAILAGGIVSFGVGAATWR